MALCLGMLQHTGGGWVKQGWVSHTTHHANEPRNNYFNLKTAVNRKMQVYNLLQGKVDRVADAKVASPV